MKEERIQVTDGFGNVLRTGTMHTFDTDPVLYLSVWDNGDWELDVPDCGCCGFSQVARGTSVVDFIDFVYKLQHPVRWQLEEKRSGKFTAESDG